MTRGDGDRTTPAGGLRDRHAETAGAFLLGALSVEDEREFAAHLATCGACTQAVAELGPTVRALSLLAAEDAERLDSAPAPDATLLPELLAHALTRQRRRRRGIAALAGVAAAAMLALAVLIGTRPWASTEARRPSASASPMTAVAANVALRAQATLSPRSWGTQITVDCSYPAAYPDRTWRYQLEVVDRSGASQSLGSWTVQAAGETSFTSGTALPADQISAVRIELPDGTAILQLTR